MYIKQQADVGMPCIGDRCRKEQVAAKAVYLMRSCRSFVLSHILDPRLWIILGASRRFLEDARTRISHGTWAQLILAPKARLLRGCRVAPVGCAAYQLLIKYETRGWTMSWFRCLLKHVQSGVVFQDYPRWERKR
jgi:hypothetical protein